MLSIPGSTTMEVFQNLADHLDLDADERADASIIAEDLTAIERWRQRDDFPDRKPFPSLRYQCHTISSDCLRYEVNGSKFGFIVRPYTTGDTMNVGIVELR